MKMLFSFLLLISFSNVFSKDLFKVKRIKSSKSNMQILKNIAKKNSKGAYIRDLRTLLRMDISELHDKHFSSNSWYPQFCSEIIKKESLKKCFLKIKETIKKNGFSYLYIDGDKNSSDFKTIYLITKGKKRKLIKLSIHEERD